MPMFSRFNTIEGNLPWDENPNLRAVLCPVSESAIHSARLKENEDVCHQADTKALAHPLSARSDSSGDEESEFSSGSNVNKTKRRNPSQRIVLVDQSGNRERFTLGTSSSNDLVLKHCGDSEEQCYINHVHAQLYPDPDEASLLVFNSSTSIFEAHSLTRASTVNRTINPGQEALLECGTWQLNFGRGLEFEMKILPYSAFTETHEMTLISPVTPPPNKHIDDVTGVHAAEPKAQGERLTQEPPPKIPTTTKRPVKTSPSGHRKVALRQQPPLSPPPVAEKPKNQVATRELIYKAPRTLVYRDIRDGVEVAVKQVRKANGKAAADEWRNEYESLRLLNHESIVKLRASSASKLTLELEYAGQDLATFVDKKRMSRISETTARQIWLDISNGLEYMHSQKVMHLDIKPKNILLGTNGRATICDFGLSVRQITDLVKHDGGTPAYVPPEYLWEGRRGPPDDIWAFGLVMMFVLGIIPMPFAGSWRIADIVTNADDESAPSVANDKMTTWIGEVQRGKRNIPEKYSLLLRMLDTDPEDQITASELVKSLRAQQTIAAPSGVLLA